MAQIDKKSLALIEPLHPDLKRVILRAFEISDVPMKVTEGMRTIERQRELKAKGLSKTLNSRHLTGHAVDLVPNYDATGDGKITGDDLYSWAAIRKVMAIMKKAAQLEGVPLEAGGDWKKFPDGPHYQLPWKQYPAVKKMAFFGASSVGELDEVMSDPRYDESDLIQPLHKQKGFLGGLLGGAGGIAVVTDSLIGVKDSLDQAQGYASEGSLLGLAIGALIVVGVAYALYDRWDDAGRPLPWKREDV